MAKSPAAANTSVKKYFPLIDLLKLFAAFFVITIHYGGFGNIGTKIVAINRFAVPFFIIVTGYFALSQDKQAMKFKAMAKKFLKLTIFWSLAYFIVFIIFKDSSHFMNYITNFAITIHNVIRQVPIIDEYTYPHGHLWYVAALCVATTFLYLLSKYLPKKWFNIILYLLPLLFIYDIYIFRQKLLFDITPNYYNYRNAWFTVLPFLSVGMLLRKHYRETKPGNLILALLIIPLWYFNTKESVLNLDFSISASAIAICFFLLGITKYNYIFKNPRFIKTTKFLGEASSFVYFSHIFLIEWMCTNKIPENLKALTALVILLAVYFVYRKLKPVLKSVLFVPSTDTT